MLCIPFSWLWMLPDDLENLGQSIVATLMFANNILLTVTTGYWDLAGEFKPLLHTWSLGVEEQFYVFFPIFFLFIWRVVRQLLVTALVLLALASFGLFLAPHFIELTPTENAAVFYSLPTRAWQLLAGGLSAIFFSRGVTQISERYQSLGSAAGLILVAISLFVPLPVSLHITMRTLIGTIGTSLLVAFASQTNIAGRLLANSGLVAIGLISYSVYLFHQPLISLTRVYAQDDPGILLMIPVALTFLCAVGAYRFIEQPFRDRARVSTKAAMWWLISVGSFLLASGLAMHLTSGFPKRVGGEAAELANIGSVTEAYNKRVFGFQIDTFTDGPGAKVLVLGNSFGRDFVNVVLESEPDTPLNIVYRSDHYDCFADNPDRVIHDLLATAEIIFLASDVLPQERCVLDDIARITRSGGRVFYIGTKHFGYNLNWIMRVPRDQRANLSNPLLEETLVHEREMASIVPSQHYLSVLGAISTGERVPITDAQGNILSPDRTHLTKAGAKLVAELMDLEIVLDAN